MGLTIGSRFGAYDVTALIGKGGMGEVYRARDTRLNRDVALKVLPDLYSHDEERMARFEREAQLLASFNHPNMVARQHAGRVRLGGQGLEGCRLGRSADRRHGAAAGSGSRRRVYLGAERAHRLYDRDALHRTPGGVRRRRRSKDALECEGARGTGLPRRLRVARRQGTSLCHRPRPGRERHAGRAVERRIEGDSSPAGGVAAPSDPCVDRPHPVCAIDAQPGDLGAAVFDRHTSVTGEPFLVAAQGTFPSLSADGTLLFTRQAGTDLRELVWVDRSGRIEGTIGQPQRGLSNPALSRDGRRIVAAAQDGEKRDVWVTDVGRGTHSRLTFTEDNELAAAWSPSGDVLFAVTLIKGERTIVAHRADGTGQPRTIVKGDFPAVSPDGGFLAYSPLGVQNVPDLSYVALKGDGKPVPFVQTPALENAPQFSPDGRYLVFMSTESGRPEIYVKPFPGGDGKWQVSLNGGGFPRWTQSGDRITFLEIAGNLMEVDVTLRPALTLSTPRLLFPIAAAGVAGGQYDIAPDGKRFLFIRDVANREGRPTPLTLVENWFGEFKNRK